MTELTTATALDILEDGDLIAVRKAGATGVKKGTASQLRDYILSNLKWKNPVRAKTTAALAANTYANGTSGVGATLTGNANGALAAQDGVTLVANDRLLVADEGTGSHNGIYIVTQVGDGSTPYILTRAADADQAGELVSAAVKVSEGSTQADNEYSCTTDGPLTIGTTALVWGVLSSGGSLASTTEQLAGTDASKRSTPDSVAALWEKGADIASSGTLTVGEGGYFHITGTTAITALALSVDKAGRKVWLKFDGALTLTHNATSLILPTGANIATAAGDIAGFVSEGSGNFRCLVYQRADGTALTSSGGGGSALTVKDEGTNLDTAVTSIDFVGAGVTSTNSGHAVTVTIPGGGGSSFRGARVKKSADQTAANFSAGAAIPWTAEDYDTDSIHDNSTNNSRLTVPSGVTYVQLSCSIYTNNVGAGSTIGLYFYKNGSLYAVGENFSSGGTTSPYLSATTGVLPVTAGDYFEAYLFCNDSSIDIQAVASAFSMEIVQGSGSTAGDTNLLQTVTVSSSVANVDLTAFDNTTYNSYRIEANHVITAGGGEFRFYLSSNGGSTWDTGSNYNNQSRVNGSDGYAANSNTQGVAYGTVVQGGTPTSAGDLWQFEMNLFSPGDTANRKGILSYGLQGPTGTVYRVDASSMWKSTAAYNAIRFFCSGSNTTGGVFKLYGIK